MPLIARTCEACGVRSQAVQTMPDPYAEELAREDDDIPEMTLCRPCARDRFEDS